MAVAIHPEDRASLDVLILPGSSAQSAHSTGSDSESINFKNLSLGVYANFWLLSNAFEVDGLIGKG